ncbi:MAG: hypothetical protein JJT94_05660 [Bernardetiaceae bacterium]|nr:hypothetical protein [Bernardetiaceae bacterium]
MLIPNITHDIIEPLRIILGYAQKNIQDLEQLENAYPDSYNGLMGLEFKNLPNIPKEVAVSDVHTWFDFHFHKYHQNPQNDYFIKCLERLQGNKFNPYFPNLAYSNALISTKLNAQEIWRLFYKSQKTEQERNQYEKLFGAGTKIAVIRKIAKKIAKANLYKYDPDLSRYNSKKNTNKKDTPFQIFKQGYGKNLIYLSTDFEKGTFEVCNAKGKHQGEYRFDGMLNSKADKNGGHDIVLQL